MVFLTAFLFPLVAVTPPPGSADTAVQPATRPMKRRIAREEPNRPRNGTSSLPHPRFLILAKAEAEGEGGSCGVRGDEPVRIAFCLYGAARDLSDTMPSISRNLLAPLRAVGAVDVLAHAMLGELDETTRSWEQNAEDPHVATAKRLLAQLDACEIHTSNQSEVDESFHLAAWAASQLAVHNIQTYSESTVINIGRSRFSIGAVRNLAMQRARGQGWKYTHVVLARPDMEYTSPLSWSPADTSVQVRFLNTFHYGGLNDRFAIGEAHAMFGAVMRQWDDQVVKAARGEEGAVDYFTTSPWNSEASFCKQVANHPEVSVGLLPLCAKRKRSDGSYATGTDGVSIADRDDSQNEQVGPPGSRSPLRMADAIQDGCLAEGQLVEGPQDSTPPCSQHSETSRSEQEQLQQWRDEVMCGEYRAIDRAKWLVENQGKVMREAKLQVIREFPEVFLGQEGQADSQSPGADYPYKRGAA